MGPPVVRADRPGAGSIGVRSSIKVPSAFVRCNERQFSALHGSRLWLPHAGGHVGLMRIPLG